MTQYLKKPNLTKDVKAFTDTLKGMPPIQDDTYEAARAALSRMQMGQTFTEEVQRNDYDVPLADGTSIHLRIVRRLEAEGNLPMIFYVHGGGWVMGDAMAYDRVLCKLAKHTRAAIVFVEYTLAPYAAYPKPLKELWGALEHILNNPGIYQVNPYQLILMGDSVGGNMATTLAYYAAQQGLNVDFQLLLYPVTNGNMNTPSYEEFANGPWLTKEGMRWFWDAYTADINMRRRPMISPLFIPVEELKGMPPTLVITAENDVLRDEGEAYAAHLSEAGVETACVRINGTIHDFIMLAPLAHTMPTKTAFRLIIATLRHVLRKGEEEIEEASNP